MASPVFVDANISFSATGRAQPLKQPCVDIIQFIADTPHYFVTDAEVLQELVHRYVAINAWSQGRSAFQAFASLMAGGIEPMYAEDVAHLRLY